MIQVGDSAPYVHPGTRAAGMPSCRLGDSVEPWSPTFNLDPAGVTLRNPQDEGFLYDKKPIGGTTAGAKPSMLDYKASASIADSVVGTPQNINAQANNLTGKVFTQLAYGLTSAAAFFSVAAIRMDSLVMRAEDSELADVANMAGDIDALYYKTFEATGAQQQMRHPKGSTFGFAILSC